MAELPKIEIREGANGMFRVYVDGVCEFSKHTLVEAREVAQEIKARLERGLLVETV